MFHSRKLNRINKLHQRALQLVYRNSNLNFQDLLALDKLLCIHHRDLQKLEIEMYKVKHNISSLLLQELFPRYENPYNLRNNRCWQTSNVRTVGRGRGRAPFNYWGQIVETQEKGVAHSPTNW